MAKRDKAVAGEGSRYGPGQYRTTPAFYECRLAQLPILLDALGPHGGADNYRWSATIWFRMMVQQRVPPAFTVCPIWLSVNCFSRTAISVDMTTSSKSGSIRRTSSAPPRIRWTAGKVVSPVLVCICGLCYAACPELSSSVRLPPRWRINIPQRRTAYVNLFVGYCSEVTRSDPVLTSRQNKVRRFLIDPEATLEMQR